MDDEKKQEVYNAFNERVNMQPKEIEEWLDTENSKSVGISDNGGESTGHKSGRAIVEIKHTKKTDLTDQQYQHMQKVVGYINRHLAQGPDGDVEHSNWRYSLMNWGHDPMKDDG